MTDEPCRLDLRAWDLVKRVLPPMPKDVLGGVIKRIEKEL
jgi:hypothetical protein